MQVDHGQQGTTAEANHAGGAGCKELTGTYVDHLILAGDDKFDN